MSNDPEPEKKPDSSAPMVMPEPDIVMKTEYVVTFECGGSVDGKRCCIIKDIIHNKVPPGAQPVTVSPQITQDPVVTPAPALPDPTANTSKDCGLCDIVADMISQKKDVKSLPKDDVPQPTAQGRRFENRPSRDGPASRQWRMSDRRRDLVAE